MDILRRIKRGEKIMITLPSRAGCERKYNLTDGTEVSRTQFAAIEEYLAPSDRGLIEGVEPQSYEWAK